MKLGLCLAMLAGCALAAALVLYQGAGDVLDALAVIEWGFAPVFGLHIAQLLCSSLGWRPLIGRKWQRSLLSLVKIRWIREGTNTLLPLAHIGGEIIGARLLSFHGVRGDVAGASVVVDITAQIITQVLFTIVGVTLLVQAGAQGGHVVDLVTGIVAALIAVGGFLLAQRFGLFKLVEHMLDRLVKKAGWLSLEGIKGLHDAIQSIHRRPRALVTSAAWHFLSWSLGAGEVWLLLHFMNAGVGLKEALILESLGQAARSAGFAVPGAIGIQEGGFLLFGTMLGVPPGAALALSLAKRLRELATSVPAVAAWQIAEGRRIFRPRARPNPSRD
ncbi:MAG TPA: lysylphosphatidylglycerol synthase domain-containing protein [Alphaproteobacteria bacterium]|nr:lysylphosphatidylglycerol synthase domain-containing protein [Alphaproteobacteria bacterium]